MVDFDGGSFRREMLGKMESSDVAYGIIKSEPHTSTTVSEAASRVLGLTKETWERHRCRAHSVVVIAVLPRRSENRTIIGEARRWVNGVGEVAVEEGGGRRCGKGMRIPVRRRSGEVRTSRRSEHGAFSHRTKRSQGGAVVERGTEDEAVETENEEETRCWRVVAGAERAMPTAKDTVDVEERGFQNCLDYRDMEREKYDFF
ncbi:hypothetical protein Bca101_086043 [Brassica carinata]